MKLNEKIKITEERLNSDERSYERLIMCFLVGSYKAAPGYRMEILSSRETSYETFAVEVSVYMPSKKAAYATFVIELSSMDIQLAGTQDAPKMIYYRGAFEEYKENDYTAYCAAADFMNRMEQAAPELADAQQAAADEPATEAETTDTAETAQAAPMTLENLYTQTLGKFETDDPDNGEILGVAVYTDGGDTVTEFADVREAVNFYGDREIQPVCVSGDYPASMTEPDAHGMLHAALVERDGDADTGDMETPDTPDAGEPDGAEVKRVFAHIARTIQAARGDAAKLETLCRMVSSIVCDERLSPEARHIREYVAYTFRNAEDVLEAFDLYYSRATEETAYHFGWASETANEPATEAPVNEKILEAVMEFLESKMYRFDDMDALSHLFELCKEADVCVGDVIAVEKSILRHFVKLYGVDGWEAYRNFCTA